MLNKNWFQHGNGFSHQSYYLTGKIAKIHIAHSVLLNIILKYSDLFGGTNNGNAAGFVEHLRVYLLLLFLVFTLNWNSYN